ncbi:MAG: hypothetical protein V3S98_10170 [Dehalococcoidia bacterium]
MSPGSGGSEQPIQTVLVAKETGTYSVEVRGSIIPFKIGNDAKGTYTLRVTPLP